MRQIKTISELKVTIGDVQQEIINLLGYYQVGDKNELLYEWNDGSEVDNGGSIIVAGQGYWKALFRREISVKDFGAKGDGNNDDTIYIQETLNNSSSSVVLFDGYFKVTSSIIIPIVNQDNSRQFVFKGAGKLSGGGQIESYSDGMSQILYDGIDGEACIKSDATQTWVEFYDIMIRDISGGSQTIGLQLKSYKSQRIEGLYILGFGINISIDGDYYYTVINKCSFTHAKLINFYSRGLSNMAHILDTRISASKGLGMDMDNMGDGLTLTNCFLEGNKGGAIKARNFRNINIYSGYIENNGDEIPIYENEKSQLLIFPYTNNIGVKSQVNIIGTYIMTKDQVNIVCISRNTGINNGNVSVNLDGVTLPSSQLQFNFDSEFSTKIVHTFSSSKTEIVFNNINYQILDNRFRISNTSLKALYSFITDNDSNIKNTIPSLYNYRSTSTNRINVPNSNQKFSETLSEGEAFLDLDSDVEEKFVIRFFRFTKSLIRRISIYNENVEKIYLDPISGEVKSESFLLGNTIKIFKGNSIPEGNFTARQGSIFVFENGDSSKLYFKQYGTGNTGWVEK